MSGRSLPLRKLTREQVVESVELYQSGLSIGKVAERMGVSRQAMHDLLKRRIKLRTRAEAVPRKEPTAIREKRLKSLRRYRSQAARITKAQIRAVKERDQVCQMCGGEGTDIDHILPVGKGGQTEMDNLQLLCNPCHHEKTGADWRGVSKKEVSSTSSESTCSVEASRSCVRTSPSPGGARGSTGHGRVFGGSSPVLLGSFDPDTSSWKTCQRSLLGGEYESLGILPRWGMTRSGRIFQLQSSGPLTGGTGSGLLPTPTAQAAKHGRGTEWELAREPALDNLHVRVAREAWPTPTARLGDQRGPQAKRYHDPARSNDLDDAVAATGPKGSLNPQFVEWLLGFPKDWTAPGPPASGPGSPGLPEASPTGTPG